MCYLNFLYSYTQNLGKAAVVWVEGITSWGSMVDYSSLALPSVGCKLMTTLLAQSLLIYTSQPLSLPHNKNIAYVLSC